MSVEGPHSSSHFTDYIPFASTATNAYKIFEKATAKNDENVKPLSDHKVTFIQKYGRNLLLLLPFIGNLIVGIKDLFTWTSTYETPGTKAMREGFFDDDIHEANGLDKSLQLNEACLKSSALSEIKKNNLSILDNEEYTHLKADYEFMKQAIRLNSHVYEKADSKNLDLALTYLHAGGSIEAFTDQAFLRDTHFMKAAININPNMYLKADYLNVELALAYLNKGGEPSTLHSDIKDKVLKLRASNSIQRPFPFE